MCQLERANFKTQIWLGVIDHSTWHKKLDAAEMMEHESSVFPQVLVMDARRKENVSVGGAEHESSVFPHILVMEARRKENVSVGARETPEIFLENSENSSSIGIPFYIPSNSEVCLWIRWPTGTAEMHVIFSKVFE
ncbi:hypothetical protein CEXT_512411 [Caerostris extrusa]|uniref:Uncharacterized protein n=1 Tax=Caerostris extrusa TaxID=172846 RepID=A0AAV4XVJ8_CAEEX|nr:hypothetical protein CEXT_512411 [Caerostris extrusa]